MGVPGAERPSRTTKRPPRRGRSVSGYVPFTLFMILGALAASFGTVALHRRSDVNAAKPFRTAGHAIVFVINGLNSDDLETTATPNLDSLAKAGVVYKRAWTGLFPGTAASIGASLATGELPKHTGILGDQWVDQKTHAIVQPDQQSQVLTGLLDGIMEATGHPSLAQRLKAALPASKVLAVGGSDCSAASALGTWSADYVVCASKSGGQWSATSVAGHAAPNKAIGGNDTVPVAHGPGIGGRVDGWPLGTEDAWVGRQAARAIATVRPALAFISFPEPYQVLPHAPAAERQSDVSALLRGIDEAIGRVVEATKRAGMHGDTVFAVVSGGSVQPVTTVVPSAKFTQAVVGTGTQTSYMTGDGAALMGISDPSQAQAAAQTIGSEHVPTLDAVFYKVARGRGWAYDAQYLNPDIPVPLGRTEAYLAGTLASAGSADVAALLAPRARVADESGDTTITGTRYGAQWGNQHGYLLIAGHGAYRDESSGYPARVVDLAPTLGVLLGIGSGVTDGTVLADSTFRAPKGAEGLQGRADKRFAPMVKALAEWDAKTSG